MISTSFAKSQAIRVCIVNPVEDDTVVRPNASDKHHTCRTSAKMSDNQDISPASHAAEILTPNPNPGRNANVSDRRGLTRRYISVINSATDS